MAKKRTRNAKTSPAATKPQTKAAFVLALPRTMPAKDVVAKGKAAGLVLSPGHIYAIRSSAKTGGKKSARKPWTTGAPSGTSAKVSHTAEDLLRAVAAELGLSRAMSILQAEHDRVQRLLGS